MKNFAITLLALCILVAAFPATAQSTGDSGQIVVPAASQSKQLVVWASGDREVGLNMVLMYAGNARKFGWVDKVRILIWGPSAKLVAGDPAVQERVKQVQAAGVEVVACRACAEVYGVAGKLGELGIQVFFAGQLLANARREGWEVLSM